MSGRAFPGGVACIAVGGEGDDGLIVAWAGRDIDGGSAVDGGTRYDLAQVTQGFVAIAALRMAEARTLDLDAPIENYVPDVRGGVVVGTPLRALFEHRAGLAEWGGLYLDVPHDAGSAAARRWIVGEAARREGMLPPGRSEVSDLGYIIAGEALSRAAGEPLDVVLSREVFEPLGIEDLVVCPGALPTDRRATLAHTIAPTERCAWRGRLIRGEVHDENASALGGVSGHAGLFATAEGLGRFGQALLDVLAGRREDYLPSARLREALAEPADGAPMRFGWTVADGTSPPYGRRMGPSTFGLVGLTGTSLFCDPERDVAVALLTNRICPSRANERIDGFRPAFHDGVITALG